MKEVNIGSYFPSIVKETKEFQEIAKTFDARFKVTWEDIETVKRDQFVYDATERGVARWESLLGITPKATESLDYRKFRIIARLNESTPYTLRRLKQQLENLCGEDGYTIRLFPEAYTLQVRVQLKVRDTIDEVDELLKRIVPANIIMDLALLYNSHEKLGRYTHGQLGGFTHLQLREEVLDG